MSAVSVHVHSTTGGSWAGDSPNSLLLPMLLGPVIFLLLAGVVVMFDPLLVLGDGDWNRSSASVASTAPQPDPLFENQEDRVVHARAPQDPQWAAPHSPPR
jgi:hypothetical protein